MKYMEFNYFNDTFGVKNKRFFSNINYEIRYMSQIIFLNKICQYFNINHKKVYIKCFSEKTYCYVIYIPKTIFSDSNYETLLKSFKKILEKEKDKIDILLLCQNKFFIKIKVKLKKIYFNDPNSEILRNLIEKSSKYKSVYSQYAALNNIIVDGIFNLNKKIKETF
jgi:hypothetical protein